MKQVKPDRLVLVQAIRVRWTKVSRRAPGAAVRNRVLEIHALPHDPPSAPWPARYQDQAPEILPPPDSVSNRAPDLYLHLVSYDEMNQFRNPVSEYWTALSSRLPETSTLHLSHWNVPPLVLAKTSDGLQVRFSWHEVPGAPPRHHLHMWEQIVLATGRWMQVRFNARLVDSDGRWYYDKHVLNIGVVSAFVPDLFINGSPDYRLSDMAYLH